MTITVIGPAGCGKTTFSSAIAGALAEKHEGVLLASGDSHCPALGVWALKGDHKTSIAQILSYSGLDEDYFERTVTISDNSNLALLGYKEEERIEDYERPTERSVRKLLNIADKLSNYIIIDGSNYGDPLTTVSIMSADVIIEIVEPDPHGLSFIKSRVYNSPNDTGSHLYLSYRRNSFDPADMVFENLNIQAFAELPFTDEAHEKLVDMKIFTQYRNNDYLSAVNKTVKELEEYKDDR